uniref:Uncharacterized protein n=1 Tax=Oryza rufipogon TaxID=4529 RepID=A0A0E0P7Z5_ORYRU
MMPTLAVSFLFDELQCVLSGTVARDNVCTHRADAVASGHQLGERSSEGQQESFQFVLTYRHDYMITLWTRSKNQDEDQWTILFRNNGREILRGEHNEMMGNHSLHCWRNGF